VSKTQ